LNRRLIAAILGVMALLGTSVTSVLASSVTITGSGSSFDQPLFQSAFSAYHKKHSNVSITYNSVGSGAGQTALDQGLVDFGAYDVPMLKSDGFKNFKKIVQLPVALGGESVFYNLKGYKKPLKLTGALLSQIYQCKIKKWNAPALVHLNPKLRSVKTKITPVYRSDSSGTTYIFTDFLSHTSASWKNKYGASKLPAWPCGAGGSHSVGVAGVVSSTPGAIGYAEAAYAKQSHFKEAFVESRDSTWLQPTLKTIASDASHIKGLSPTHFSVVYSAGAHSYPITGFSWAGVYKHESNKTKCRATVGLLHWLVTKGEEKYGPPLIYAKLPRAISRFATRQLSRVKC